MKRARSTDIFAGNSFQNFFDHRPLFSTSRGQGAEAFDSGEVVAIRWDFADIVTVAIAIA